MYLKQQTTHQNWLAMANGFSPTRRASGEGPNTTTGGGGKGGWQKRGGSSGVVGAYAKAAAAPAVLGKM